MKLNSYNEKFYQEVYEIVKEIPEGCVTTYGEIAQLLGRPNNSRMVGNALSVVPIDLSLPCHRVVNAQGRLVPGWIEQKQLLMVEGVIFRTNGYVNMKQCRWKWEAIFSD
ncbi:MAG: MGMT family protein [Bacteroides sp.]|nr:MGMT family protein [Bacteroides sp.]